jgi:hypothetical protein
VFVVCAFGRGDGERGEWATICAREFGLPRQQSEDQSLSTDFWHSLMSHFDR